MEKLAIEQLAKITSLLKKKKSFQKMTVEMWPTNSEEAQPTWVYARYQLDDEEAQWFEAEQMTAITDGIKAITKMFL